MRSEKRVLALVPARGGSKGLPGKNTRQLQGKPLIAWTIEAARAARLVSHVVVSTDDESIRDVARQHGADVPFMRPSQLATDTATTIEVVLHALSVLPTFDWVVLLQPTSPLRSAEDIDAALSLCIERDAPACVSVCEAGDSPYWMFDKTAEDRLKPFMEGALPLRRQALPPLYSLNGAVYVARPEWLTARHGFLSEQTLAYVMPPERSVDIDTLFDFRLAECLCSIDG